MNHCGLGRNGLVAWLNPQRSPSGPHRRHTAHVARPRQPSGPDVGHRVHLIVVHPSAYTALAVRSSYATSSAVASETRQPSLCRTGSANVTSQAPPRGSATMNRADRRSGSGPEATVSTLKSYPKVGVRSRSLRRVSPQRRSTTPVTVLGVEVAVWQTKLKLASKDVGRIQVVDARTVIVHNPGWNQRRVKPPAFARRRRLPVGGNTREGDPWRRYGTEPRLVPLRLVFDGRDRPRRVRARRQGWHADSLQTDDSDACPHCAELLRWGRRRTATCKRACTATTAGDILRTEQCDEIELYDCQASPPAPCPPRC